MNEDDFIPVNHRLSELLAKLETIESVLKLAEYCQKQKKTSGKRLPDQRSRQLLMTPNKRKKFFCREHGHNNTHASADCKVLQAEASGTFRPKGNDDKKKMNRKFLSKAFRKELNAMTKSKSAKKKYLEKYLCALEKELEKVNASDAESEPSDDSSEDSDASFSMMEVDANEKNVVTSAMKPPKATSKTNPRTVDSV